MTTNKINIILFGLAAAIADIKNHKGTHLTKTRMVLNALCFKRTHLLKIIDLAEQCEHNLLSPVVRLAQA